MTGTRACIVLTVAISFGCILAVAAQQTVTQDASAADQRQAAEAGSPQSGNTLPTVTVTGSIVPRIGEAIQPVVSLDRDYFERNGDAQSVSDALVRWPSNTNAVTPLVTAGNSFTPAGSNVNLRGLGPTRTLVLVDGRRFNAYPFPIAGAANFVDLNSIPMAAVDRIEILKDGGTATYGDDAIAGVVNIILKDEYNGADLRQYYGISQRGDDEVYHTQLVAGTSQNLTETSRFTLLAALDYYESSPVLAKDRWYSNIRNHSKFGSYEPQSVINATAGQFTDAAGNIYTLNPGVKGGATVSDFTINTPPNSNFSTEDIDLQAREQRYGAFIKAKYEPTQWLRFYEEFQCQRNEEVGVSPNSGISSTDGLIVPANNPYNPFGFAVQPAGQALPELGAMREDATVDTYRTVTGFTLQLPKSWFVDGSFLYSESDGDQQFANTARLSLLQAALNGTLPGREGVFFNPFVDEAVNQDPNDAFRGRLTGTQDLNVRSSLLTWSLRAGGVVIEWPSGPISVGGGIDYRSEEFIESNDRPSRTQVLPNTTVDGIPVGPVTQTDFAAASFPGPLTNARRRVTSLYGELTVPVLGGTWAFPGARLLELALSERYDNYSDFGSAAKPKIAIRYKPFDDFTVRASYSEGFIAPSLSQLFSTPIVGIAQITDPLTGMSETPLVSYTGNARLKPETSYQYYIEGSWSPGANNPERSLFGFLRGLTVYGDWYQIQVRDAISQLPAQLIVDEPNAFPEAQVVRGPGNQVTRISIPFLNLQAFLTAGFEFGASYVTREFNWGKLDAEVNANYMYLYSRKQPEAGGSRLVDLEDSFTLPDFKLTASVFYSKTVFGIDRVRTGLSLNYIDSEHDRLDNYKGTLPGAQVEPNGLVHRIGSWATLDWQLSYTVGRSGPSGPDLARPGYDKDGKRLAAEQAISPKPDASSKSVRAWLADTTLTLGINNVADTRPPFADTPEGYDTETANPYQRYFYVEVEKKF